MNTLEFAEAADARFRAYHEALERMCREATRTMNTVATAKTVDDVRWGGLGAATLLAMGVLERKGRDNG